MDYCLLLDDPPERAARIRSQVLERYHNKLIEGEHSIQQRRKEIQQHINQAAKEIEREYQKRRRQIEKELIRASHGLKQTLLDVSIHNHIWMCSDWYYFP